MTQAAFFPAADSAETNLSGPWSPPSTSTWKSRCGQHEGKAHTPGPGFAAIPRFGAHPVSQLVITGS